MLRQFASAPSKAARLAARVPRTTAATTPLFQTATPFRSVAATAVRSRQSLSASRWYSSETDASKAEAGDAAAKETKEGEAAGEPLSAADAAALRKELETKTQEVIDWKDKYVRSVADFRNLQERTKREVKSARDFAITGFAKDLVDSVDNLDRALSMVPEKKPEAVEGAEDANQDFGNLVDGIKMTETVLINTLKKHGLERFDPNGDKFDPNEHEATFMTPMPDKEHNTVFHTQQKGFRLNGRVLRAAKVGVVNNNK
ncbi:GrpE, mitochondrial [Sporothrix eucalyptigena]|uniref:GrpE protein homolog n=1 Tax=Sporothrix eucalyptigena TaxID=1812306 RepID=A0ABP0BDP6_9PEZI